MFLTGVDKGKVDNSISAEHWLLVKICPLNQRQDHPKYQCMNARHPLMLDLIQRVASDENGVLLKINIKIDRTFTL